jgi:hypothetical protein
VRRPGAGNAGNAGNDIRQPKIGSGRIAEGLEVFPAYPAYPAETGGAKGFIRAPFDLAAVLDLRGALPRHWLAWREVGGSLLGIACRECASDLAASTDALDLANRGWLWPMHWPDCGFHYSARRARTWGRRRKVRGALLGELAQRRARRATTTTSPTTPEAA